MKNIFKLLLFASIIFSACKKEGIMAFDADSSYIHFNMPFVVNDYGKLTKKRVDSLLYSFALDDNSVKQYTFKIPISIVGYSNDEDREYKVTLDEENSNVKNEDWDKTSIEETVIRKGNIFDTLYVTVNRSSILKTEYRYLTLKLEPNNNFATGDYNLTTAKISFSDILQPPKWWKTWQSLFGDFCKEKYVKWQEIYYLGADPNILTWEGYPGTGKQFYWDQMPPNPWDFPVTLMYVRILKQYFLDNEVYPDGDTSKPRILLPN